MLSIMHKSSLCQQLFLPLSFNPNSISKKVDERNTNYLLDCLNVIQKDIEHFDRKDEFVQALYQRVAYIVIAIAMSTYFILRTKIPCGLRCLNMLRLLRTISC